MRAIVTVILGGVLISGCDFAGQQLATLLPGSREVRIPAHPQRGQTPDQVGLDMSACDTDAGRAERHQDDVYVACMVSRGYRTFFGVAIPTTLTQFGSVRQFEVTMSEPRPSERILADLHACQDELRARAKTVKGSGDIWSPLDEGFKVCMSARGLQAIRWEPR